MREASAFPKRRDDRAYRKAVMVRRSPLTIFFDAARLRFEVGLGRKARQRPRARRWVTERLLVPEASGVQNREQQIVVGVLALQKLASLEVPARAAGQHEGDVLARMVVALAEAVGQNDEAVIEHRLAVPFDHAIHLLEQLRNLRRLPI